MPTVDRKHFADNFPSSALFGKKLDASRKEAFDAIFVVWDEIAAGKPLEGLAYALATAWHETGATMLPVREGFKKTDEEAFQHVSDYCARNGKPNYAARESNGNSYYGRGYVQLTHGANYKKIGERLGFGSSLYDNPDEVMQPRTAGRILLVGMIGGEFRPTKGKLDDYFGGGASRWFEARELINGDKEKEPEWAKPKNIGTLIADYAKGFSGALRYA